MRPFIDHLFVAFFSGVFILAACSAQAVANDALSQPANEAEAPGEVAVDAKAVELLNKIEAASAKLATLKARVMYSRVQALTGDEQVRFGDFYYRAAAEGRPTQFAVLFDRLVLDQAKQRSRTMQTWYIFDGNWLLERDHEVKQATRRELVPKGGESDGELSLGNGRLPIPLRLQADKILKSYHVKLMPDEVVGDRRLHHLSLTPKQAGGKQEPLDLFFHSETMLLYRVQTEIDGDPVTLNLPTPKANAEIQPEIFATKLPKESDGWQVQEVPLQR